MTYSSYTTSSRLPQIQDELERSIIATRALLDQLPRPPTSDPRSELSTLLHQFANDLLSHVQGVPAGTDSSFGLVGLIQSIRPAQERFKRTIRDTAPKFKPFKRSHGANRQLSYPDFLRSEENEEEESGISVQEEPESKDKNLFTFDFSSLDQSKKKRKKSRDENIYIDEVLDRAHQ